ncbi:hypothetical protein [Mycolicibacterium hodleri]|uniref:hypothetical protein n=1 Tax=Mycolicibacterium hodleri TaxID=49897 RepID=UPI0013756EA2|nr:hypothetical protein [Mycolicibacterium hodleri]
MSVELPFEYEPAVAILTMLDVPVSSASSQLAELAGPFEKAWCDDAPGTEPLHVGAAAATPAKPSALTANPAATSNVFPKETILTIDFPHFRFTSWWSDARAM